MTTKNYSPLITRLIVLLFLTAMAPVCTASQPTSNIKKVFSCAYEGCSKNFNRKSNLTRHFRTHTGERPFACTYPDCKKNFTNKHHLTAHFRTHTGERPYKCSHQSCTKAFAEKSSLRKHLKTHSRETTYTTCIPKTISKETKQINNTQFHLLPATQAKPKDTNVQDSKIDSHDELNPAPCIDIPTLLTALLLLKIQLQDADIIKQLRSAMYQDQLIKIVPLLQDLLNNPDNWSLHSSEQHNQHLAKLIKSFDKSFLKEILLALQPCPISFNNQESLS